MLEFILERYNYWISICLMLTGLYIVFSRGNLVKTLIGLNLFQTSVFIFYITLGKIAGGTAPIIIKSGEDKGHGGDHGEIHGADKIVGDHSAETSHATKEGIEALNLEPNEIGALDNPGDLPTTNHTGSLHTIPVETLPEGASNDLYTAEASETDAHAGDDHSAHNDAPSLTAQSHDAGGHDGGHEAGHEAVAALGDVIYSNPLPHVLILTAIVVGVATTAVGLGLAVRIREAYGTIEEDELEEADHLAEFGKPLPKKETPA